MVKNVFKLFLVLFFIFGIIGISIIKNISVQKKNYITQLQLELYKQQETFRYLQNRMGSFDITYKPWIKNERLYFRKL